MRLLTLSLSLVVAFAAALVAAPRRAWAADTYTVTIGQYKNGNYTLGTLIKPEDVLDANGVVFTEVKEGPLTSIIQFDSEASGRSITIECKVDDLTYFYTDSDASCTKNATPPAPSVDSVTVSPESLELVAGGDTGTLTASVLPKGADQGVTWKSSDESVATVSDQGVVTPVAAGTATITATSVVDATKSGTCAVTVSAPKHAVTVTLTFDANGGTGTMDPQTGEAGSTITLDENKFTRSGYAFAGWNTSKDGSGTSYKDKAEVKLDGNMTLYAQWTKNATATTATKSSTSGTTNSAKSSTTPKTGDPASLAAAAVAAASGAASLAGGTALRRHAKRRGRHLRR